MPHSKAARAGPTAEADCRRSAGIPQCHHCLVVNTPSAGCLKNCKIVLNTYTAAEMFIKLGSLFTLCMRGVT